MEITETNTRCRGFVLQKVIKCSSCKGGEEKLHMLDPCGHMLCTKCMEETAPKCKKCNKDIVKMLPLIQKTKRKDL